MPFHRHYITAMALMLATIVSACGDGSGKGLFGGGSSTQSTTEIAQAQSDSIAGITRTGPGNRSTFRDLFRKGDDPSTTIKVNKYIWAASLDVLNFLPVESVDPFTGVIVTGYGKPPGGGRAYRATILVQDPALDARSLKLSLQTQGGGAVDPATVRAVEDAILSRARELRIVDSRL
jgi:hypothetical protein